MACLLVRVGCLARQRADVNGGVGEPADVVQQPVPYGLGTPKMAMQMSIPATGSAGRHPAATPAAPITTASEVKPSVRACNPSATSAAEPILRPTRIR